MKILNTKNENSPAAREETARRFIGELASELEWAYTELQREIDRDLRLLSGIEIREKKIQEQTEKISNQTIEIERLQKRLLGLEGSKLMRFQRKYWRIRKKVKRIVPWTLTELKNKKRDWWS